MILALNPQYKSLRKTSFITLFFCLYFVGVFYIKVGNIQER